MFQRVGHARLQSVPRSVDVPGCDGTFGAEELNPGDGLLDAQDSPVSRRQESIRRQQSPGVIRKGLARWQDPPTSRPIRKRPVPEQLAPGLTGTGQARRPRRVGHQCDPESRGAVQRTRNRCGFGHRYVNVDLTRCRKTQEAAPPCPTVCGHRAIVQLPVALARRQEQVCDPRNGLHAVPKETAPVGAEHRREFGDQICYSLVEHVQV
jgi:hypothetical protein